MTGIRVSGRLLLIVAVGSCGGKNGSSNGDGGSGGRAGSGGVMGTGGQPMGSGGAGSGGVGSPSNSGGSVGSGGSAGSGGSVGSGGAGGAGGNGAGASAGAIGGSSGRAGASGTTGGATPTGGSGGASTGTPAICTFTVQANPSVAIPTVGVVDWSTDLSGMTGARVDFTLNDPAVGEINTGSGGPIDISGTQHRALLLGLKPVRSYTYRITATVGTTVCISADQPFTTGAATGAPTVARTAANATAQARGFIIATAGVPWSGHGAAPQLAYIIDADGVVVWWAAAPEQCGQALMDWDGENMWMQNANPSDDGSATGEMRRIAMDGTGSQAIAELARGNHDFAVLPGGVVAALVFTGEASAVCDLVEWSPDGTVKTVVRLDSKIYPPDGSYFHANALRYHQSDDSYTVGDRDARLIVKLTRQGKLLWQVGADCSGTLAPKCAVVDWAAVHGHHLLDDGHLLVFDNGVGPFNMPTSVAREYDLAEGTSSLAATQTWSYSDANLGSVVLGDVQRLPNGNTLMTDSTAGVMEEISPSGELVQTITGATFGYSNFRETLYGPPPP